MTDTAMQVGDLKKFRDVQKLAYDCVEHVRSTLRNGMTERDACALMKKWMKEHGVRDQFHDPFAWFGDRSAFKGFWADHKFLPSRRAIADGMAVILDIAPAVDGYAADIGYAYIHAPDRTTQAAYDGLMRTLMQCRDLIVRRVREGKTFKAIYEEADAVIKAAGYVNQHKRYPHRVIGHRIGRLPPSRLSAIRWLGFGLPTYLSLISRQWGAKLIPTRVSSPLWNDGRESNHAPFEGLWAIEPHIALPDLSLAAKWEEILVIGKHDAWWLDDDVPHCRLATQKGWWQSSTPSAMKTFAGSPGTQIVLASI